MNPIERVAALEAELERAAAMIAGLRKDLRMAQDTIAYLEPPRVRISFGEMHYEVRLFGKQPTEIKVAAASAVKEALHGFHGDMGELHEEILWLRRKLPPYDVYARPELCPTA